MIYLLISGIVAIAFGTIILIAPIFLKKFCATIDKLIFNLDDLLQPLRAVIGVILILVATAVYYISFRYPEIQILNVIWVIAAIFGLLFLFFPNWLKTISKVADTVIFPTKEYVMSACRVCGVIILLAGVYILIIYCLYCSRAVL